MLPWPDEMRESQAMENIQACAQGHYPQVVDIIRHSNYNFSFGPFWTHKIKTKVEYKSISNILHLLSTPDSVPHAEPVLARLVIDSLSNCKFSVGSNFEFDCCFMMASIQSENKEICSFIIIPWTKYC